MKKPVEILFFSLAAAIFATPLQVLADAPEVRANSEHLQGQWFDREETVAAFKGIPFAAPPLGDLRWRAPRPHLPRNGMQQATEFAAGCMQGPHTTKWYADVAAEFGAASTEVGKPNGVSEDCLYLNVWTPDLPMSEGASQLPVMVWFHGGSNKGGWSYEPNYIGGELAKKGVVVVSTAYRLGPFGFFSHPALAKSQPGEAIANFGFLDQVATLEWVENHISSLGGDPDNVTCFGESSGAGDLGNFFTVATDLCDRFIAQSPATDYSTRNSLAFEQQNGLKISAQLDIGNSADADQLRAISAEDVLAAADLALAGHYYDVVNDDLTLKISALESLSREDRPSIDFMVGTNRDEWYMYIPEDASQEAVDRWLAEEAPANADVLRAQVADETDPRRALDRLRTAKRMLCPGREVAGRVSAIGGRAWVYNFSRQRAGTGGEKLRAYHGTEIPYVFNTHDDWLPTQKIDMQLTSAVMDYWVQFARTGDPNTPGRPVWPMYRDDEPAVLELGDEIQVVPPADAALCIWLGPE